MPGKEGVYVPNAGGRALLITVLKSGILLNAAEKHLAAAELQQFTVLLLMEGHDPPPGVDPNPPQILCFRLLHKAKAPFIQLLLLRRLNGLFCFTFFENFFKIFQEFFSASS
jgi:hypothetical protein